MHRRPGEDGPDDCFRDFGRGRPDDFCGHVGIVAVNDVSGYADAG